MNIDVFESEIYCPANQDEWRNWLEQNHETRQSVWLIYYKKQSGKPTISWSEAVDHALCFGWVDSKKKTIDKDRFMQFFCKRNRKSTWSKINKQKVLLLNEKGLIHEAGKQCIEKAIENGSWSVIDEVEELIIPKSLQTEFDQYPGAESFFTGLSRSVRKSMLQWITLAQREGTATNRIKDIAYFASIGLKPKQFR